MAGRREGGLRPLGRTFSNCDGGRSMVLVVELTSPQIRGIDRQASVVSPASTAACKANDETKAPTCGRGDGSSGTDRSLAVNSYSKQRLGCCHAGTRYHRPRLLPCRFLVITNRVIAPSHAINSRGRSRCPAKHNSTRRVLRKDTRPAADCHESAVTTLSSAFSTYLSSCPATNWVRGAGPCAHRAEIWRNTGSIATKVRRHPPTLKHLTTDRHTGSGIAPFFPVQPPASSTLLFPWHLFLFCIRIPLLVLAWLVWLTIIQWLPAGGVLRKANQWCLLGIPGVWWIDLQVDGVRRGSLCYGSPSRLPSEGTIIASSYTSPLDVLYLAAIFDPIFTQSYPGSRLVQEISQESALAACFGVRNPLALGAEERMVELEKLVKQNPSRTVVVFPEATTSNGRGILRFSPSLLSAGSQIKIFPVSLRYTPADVVSPIPGWFEIFRFIWVLNSRPTHCIRVRVGGARRIKQETGDDISMAKSTAQNSASGRGGFESNFFDTLQASPPQKVSGARDSEENVTTAELTALDVIADDLARLGRVKRVNLGMSEKARFIEAWNKGSRSRK